MRRFYYDTEFIERPCTIELISIGICAEDSEDTFYAVSSEFNSAHADTWVRKNVLTHLDNTPRQSVAEIAQGILDYLQPTKDDPIELWAYYSAYDHVALCWIFGRMIDLPPGMPMYTKDLKMLLDLKGNPLIPKQDKNEHHALADAKWVRETYHLLQRLEFNNET